MVLPFVAPFVFVDAEFVRGVDAAREIGRDERDVAFARVGRMHTVGFTLPGRASMRVNVGNQFQTGRVADLRNRAQKISLEADDATVEAVRVEIVVRHDFLDATATFFAATEQERAALTPVAAALMEFVKQFVPQARRATEPVLRPGERPDNGANGSSHRGC